MSDTGKRNRTGRPARGRPADRAEGRRRGGRRGRGRPARRLFAPRPRRGPAAGAGMAGLRGKGDRRGVRGHARRQAGFQGLYRRRADAPVVQPGAARDLRHCAGRRRVRSQARRYGRDRTLQSGRDTGTRQLPSPVQDFAPGQGGRRPDMGHGHALRFLRHLLQRRPHEPGGERGLEFAVSARACRQGRRSGLVPAEHGHCEPRGSSRQAKPLRPERRAARRGQGVAAQTEATGRHAGRQQPAHRAGHDRRRHRCRHGRRPRYRSQARRLPQLRGNDSETGRHPLAGSGHRVQAKPEQGSRSRVDQVCQSGPCPGEALFRQGVQGPRPEPQGSRTIGPPSRTGSWATTPIPKTAAGCGWRR